MEPTNEIVPRNSAGFADAGLAAPTSSAQVSAAAREEAEIKAGIALARMNPRSEAACYQKIMEACDRPGLANAAVYNFPRGGSNVTGPTVDLARELARIWGNVRYGLRVIDTTDTEVHIRGWAHDMETNSYREIEDRFPKRVQRRRDGATKWIVTDDERDIREMVNRRGAICVRNAILQVMPADIVDDAFERCRATMRKAAAGELKADRETTVRRLVEAFAKHYVTADMLERRLGHPVTQIDDEELSDLRAIYRSIADGHSKRDEHFEIRRDGPAGTSPAGTKLDALGGTSATPPPSGPQFDPAEIVAAMDGAKAPKRAAFDVDGNPIE